MQLSRARIDLFSLRPDTPSFSGFQTALKRHSTADIDTERPGTARRAGQSPMGKRRKTSSTVHQDAGEDSLALNRGNVSCSRPNVERGENTRPNEADGNNRQRAKALAEPPAAAAVAPMVSNDGTQGKLPIIYYRMVAAVFVMYG